MFLFGAETWVVTPHIGQALGGSQDQVERRMMGRLPQLRLNGRWEYTSAESEIAEAKV